MIVIPVRAGLNERGTPAGTGVIERPACHLSHRPHIIAVYGLTHNAQGSWARKNPSGRHGFHWCELAVKIVLTDVDDRERVDSSEVQTFSEVGLIDCAIAKECNRHPASAAL